MIMFTMYKRDIDLINVMLISARRAAKEAKDSPAQPAPEKPRVDIKKFVKIGRPGYKGNVDNSMGQLKGLRDPLSMVLNQKEKSQ